MKVLKFGGTSVGSVENMRKVYDIVTQGERKMVVLSAMSKVTNGLVQVIQNIKDYNVEEAKNQIDILENKHLDVVAQLVKNPALLSEGQDYIRSSFDHIRSFLYTPTDGSLEFQIIGQGELLSTKIFYLLLKENNKKVRLLSALQFMRIDRDKEPDYFYIKKSLSQILEQDSETEIFITQGFICVDYFGEMANLDRGGSDYTATIIGACIHSDIVEIWTDIDGLHNNDPRYIDNTKSVPNISYEEAAELAYFGAKILHPLTIIPVKELGIPVVLKNTMEPSAKGTIINGNKTSTGPKSIAVKGNITSIKITSARMFQLYGFLKKVFDVFDRYGTSVDMITTSEIAVSLTIDNEDNLADILRELKLFSTVEVDKNLTIVSIVGNQIVSHSTVPNLFQILHEMPVRMISYGGSKNNISLLIPSENKTKALELLNGYLY